MVTVKRVHDAATLVDRIMLNGITPGQPVTGRTVDGAWEWTVASSPVGVSLIDPLAPIGTDIVYTQGGQDAAPIRRDAAMYGAVTSLDGRTVVPAILPHKWEDDETPDVTVHQVGGRAWPVYGQATTRAETSLDLRIEGVHVRAMRRLIRAQQPVVVHHVACPVPECVVPPARAGIIRAVSSTVTARKDLGEMTYTATFQTVDLTDIRPGGVPAATWWDVEQRFPTVWDLQSETAWTLAEGGWNAD
ncbi:hypothetical protein EKN07_09000 [Actinobaculum sp. 352]|nr:hypothetical protein EKN07_09000 [Actinobaculum sp. 352]